MSSADKISLYFPSIKIFRVFWPKMLEGLLFVLSKLQNMQYRISDIKFFVSVSPADLRVLNAVTL